MMVLWDLPQVPKPLPWAPWPCRPVRGQILSDSLAIWCVCVGLHSRDSVIGSVCVKGMNAPSLLLHVPNITYMSVVWNRRLWLKGMLLVCKLAFEAVGTMLSWILNARKWNSLKKRIQLKQQKHHTRASSPWTSGNSKRMLERKGSPIALAPDICPGNSRTTRAACKKRDIWILSLYGHIRIHSPSFWWSCNSSSPQSLFPRYHIPCTLIEPVLREWYQQLFSCLGIPWYRTYLSFSAFRSYRLSLRAV
jgi:hypothetical protein